MAGSLRVQISVTAGPAKGQTFVFEQPDCFLFGRALDARISLPDDPYVSRHHFVLEISPPDCKVTDLESKNGTFVNDVRLGGTATRPGVPVGLVRKMESRLASGDEIIVGDTRMQVEIVISEVCSRCTSWITPAEQADARIINGAHVCPACAKRAHESTLSQISTPPRRRIVSCARCSEDVTDEAGVRGQAEGAEYICEKCRQKVKKAPLGRLRDLLRGASAEPPAPAPVPVPAPAPARAPAPDLPATLESGPGGSDPHTPFSGYQIQSRLGEGGMATVYKALEMRTGRIVAIKTMLPEVASSPEGVRSFLREVDLTRQLKHENIVELVNFGTDHGSFYFIMEYVEGMNLEGFAKERGGRIPLAEAAPLMLGTLAGLSHAHRAVITVKLADEQETSVSGIVHRDLKPSNIFLSRATGRWVAKVADFGLAKAFATAGLTDMTRPGKVSGTPTYWPREQLIHYRFLVPATDVFSSAAVFYELLTGFRIRDGMEDMLQACQKANRAPTISDYVRVICNNQTVPIRRRNPDIPPAVAQVFDRALTEGSASGDAAKVRSALSALRYADAGEFHDALKAALIESGIRF
jgi:hypothetical protein